MADTAKNVPRITAEEYQELVELMNGGSADE